MSITITKGDLLAQDVDAIINTVNCVGVMGKGIALQFKRKWPENCNAYIAACKNGEVQIGKMFVHELGALFNKNPRFIINFPTKNHWKENSKLSYIEEGLKDLVQVVTKLGITSLAMPPLGCGNGGLEWKDVRTLIEKVLEPIKDTIEIKLFDPHIAAQSVTIVTRTEKPNMTIGRAILIKLVSIYSAVEDSLSRLEIQKLCYFIQEAGEPLRLNYVKNKYGPYADNLRHVLTTINNHFLKGVEEQDTSISQIILMPGVLTEVDKFLKDSDESNYRIKKVRELIEGFEGPRGMELLSTVHWVCNKEPKAQTFEEVIKAIYRWDESHPEWNKRKLSLMPEREIAIAWEHLSKLGWIKQ